MKLIPLTQARKSKPYFITAVNNNEESNRFFYNIGCTSGESITIISKVSGNYIVKIKDGRFGIDKRFADKIMVEPQ